MQSPGSSWLSRHLGQLLRRRGFIHLHQSTAVCQKRLKCRIAVIAQGSLPMNFGEEFIRTKENIDFVGLSGRVIFDKNGDRLISSAHYMLANVLRRRQEANAWSFELVQKATFRDGSWSWHSGMMDLIFNHDSTDLPTDSLLETPPPPAPPPPNKSSYTAEYVLFFVCIVIASVLVFLLLCLAIAFAFLRLRAISHKFGIRPVALAKLLFRRRLQPRRELRPPKYPLALSKLKVAVANHQHLHTLFRKYCADGQIMRVEEWLQFQRDEQHEFDANQATKPFLAVALALEHQSKGEAH
uniref:Receptor ligand binding region domain-containing protein n=1 Tax=Chrysotila carterae TaxID=13221 RepID=A0A7S4F6S7_CHRCT